MLRFRGLSLKNVILLAFFAAILCSIKSYFATNQLIKNQEKSLSKTQLIKLYLLRTTHYFTSVTFAWFYPFFSEFALFNDVIVLAFILIAFLHRIYFGECILSIIEKKILDSSYKAGSTPDYEPYYVQLFDLTNSSRPIFKDLTKIPYFIVLIRVVYGYYYRK